MIKEKVKGIIDKLTTETNSILSEKIYDLAAELGIGDLHVKDSIHELMDENYIDQPVLGVIKKL